MHLLSRRKTSTGNKRELQKIENDRWALPSLGHKRVDVRCVCLEHVAYIIQRKNTVVIRGINYKSIHSNVLFFRKHACEAEDSYGIIQFETLQRSERPWHPSTEWLPTRVRWPHLKHRNCPPALKRNRCQRIWGLIETQSDLKCLVCFPRFWRVWLWGWRGCPVVQLCPPTPNLRHRGASSWTWGGRRATDQLRCSAFWKKQLQSLCRSRYPRQKWDTTFSKHL